MRKNGGIAAIVAAALLTAGVCAFAACDPGGDPSTSTTPATLTVDGTVHFVGEDTITLTIATDGVTFRADVDEADVTAGNALLLKRTTNVEYLSPTQIEVTLASTWDGTTTTSGEGAITVAGDAMSNGLPATGTVTPVKSEAFASATVADVAEYDDDRVAEHPAVSVTGTVSDLTTQQSGSKRFQLTDGDASVYVLVGSTVSGFDRVTDGARVTVKGVVQEGRDGTPWIELYERYPYLVSVEAAS